MSAVAEVAVRAERRPVYEGDAPPLYLPGGHLRCPQCERVQPDWRYKRLMRNPLYASQTVDVLKCGPCGHVFAPVGG